MPLIEPESLRTTVLWENGVMTDLVGFFPFISCNMRQCDNKPENLKAVYVLGDSMIDERINDDDIVIFNIKIKQTDGNGIYVVSVANTLVVKRVDFDHANKTIELIAQTPPTNPAAVRVTNWKK